jgi:uncharacterized protein (DUF2235 family)
MTQASIDSSGVTMKNIVLCFDRAARPPGRHDVTTVDRLFRLLHNGPTQIAWYDAGLPGADRNGIRRAWHRHNAAAGDAILAIAEAYTFLLERWESGDRIYLFGVGRGGSCAQALTRLLGTVGLESHLTDYVLAAYAAPRTHRTPQDWRRVAQLFASLSEHGENIVPVQFLGLWDAIRVPGLPRATPAPIPNVLFGRHAVAIDGPRGECLLAEDSPHIDEVWFRGAHCDLAGGPGACRPLTDIAFDWMLDGAARAGVAITSRGIVAAPGEYDALAGGAPRPSLRRMRADALVHASVELYLRERPGYWGRLPRHVIWADADWAARGERLMPDARPAMRAESAALAAMAS